MRTLVVIRHAKSEWAGNPPDLERPVATRGLLQGTEAGAWIATHMRPLDLAVVSPARRAQQTWALVAAELDPQPPMVTEDRIYSMHGLMTVVRGLPADARRVALIGHEPSVSDLVSELTGHWVEMKTSAVAVIEIKGLWADARKGRLVAHGRPPGRLAEPGRI